MLDKNGDGNATDGTELFDPMTGNGFSELAAFDRDGISWIDEADEVFNRLRIWTKDVEGHDILSTLGEKNIGALTPVLLIQILLFLTLRGRPAAHCAASAFMSPAQHHLPLEPPADRPVHLALPAVISASATGNKKMH